MSIKKQLVKSGSICKATFRLTSAEVGDAEEVSLLGCFTNWNSEAVPMKRLKSGDFSAVVNFPVDNVFEFRYLVDGEEWYNDTDADGYIQNDYSSENCLIKT